MQENKDLILDHVFFFFFSFTLTNLVSNLSVLIVQVALELTRVAFDFVWYFYVKDVYIRNTL